MRVPYAEGQFVHTNFPYREAPTRPGERRIGYIMGIDRKTDPDNPTAMVLYTTSSENWMRQNEGKRGFLQFTERQARDMGQDRAFMIQAGRIARLPLNASYFPEINNRSTRNGIVGVAPPKVRDMIKESLVTMIRAFPHKIERSGPNGTVEKPKVETIRSRSAEQAMTDLAEAKSIARAASASGGARRKILSLK